VKAYFDPGKYGRIAAGVIGLVLVVVGFWMYSKTPVPAAAAAPTPAAAAPVPAATTPAPAAAAPVPAAAAPVPAGARKGMAGGGEMSTFCKFYQGPKAGTTHDFAGKGQPRRVGAVCRDGQGSEGFVVAAPQ
jgi:hypothetical protein